MKRLIIALTTIVSFASCEQCYTCHTSTTYTPSSIGGNAQTTTEFCGTRKEKEAYEKAGTTTTTATSGSIKVTQRTTTSCQ